MPLPDNLNKMLGSGCMKTYRQQEKPMDYDKELTKLATAYNNADCPKVNSVALGLLDDYRQLNTQMKAQLSQLQYENATLRLTLEHSSNKVSSLIEIIEDLEYEPDTSDDLIKL